MEYDKSEEGKDTQKKKSIRLARLEERKEKN